jgi:hypothetical protein
LIKKVQQSSSLKRVWQTKLSLQQMEAICDIKVMKEIKRDQGIVPRYDSKLKQASQQAANYFYRNSSYFGKITQFFVKVFFLNYKIDIDYYENITYDYDKICLLKYIIIYILYNYIEKIKNYIIDTEFNKLVPIIIYKCYEIRETIKDNKKIPNNLKLLFLKQISNVCNIFAF